jgi:tRNA (cytidine32/uridine32-2'-O)-methyltransferase
MGRDPHIILVRPQEEGNVGAVARAMANMGLRKLLIVEPAVTLGATARAFAVGAHDVLDGHRRVASLEEALGPYGRTVGTTSTRDRRIGAKVPLLTPRELPAVLDRDPPDTPTALVFGPEPSGLTADELARLSPLVTVPCSPLQPTLNLAQAVLIVVYELFLHRLQQGRAEAAGERGAAAGAAERREPPASATEVEGLFGHAREVLAAVGFDRDDTFESTLQDLRRLAGRAGLTGREVAILRGICRRTWNAVRRRER